MNSRVQIKQIVGICLIVVLVLVILISGLKIIEALSKKTEAPIRDTSIVRNGVKYLPRTDINVMLVMGIGEEGPITDSGSYENKAEADMLALVIFDETNKKIDIINLNRDAMVDMEDLGIGGKSAGTVTRQLAMAYTYGSGMKDSCEYTRETVSNLFYGLGINYYVAMNMDAIPILNDAVGGVTVNVTEDFSKVNPDIPMGETILMGQAALDYVQIRKDIGDQTNTSRMARQEKYMKSFLEVFKQKVKTDDAFLLKTFDAVDEYMVTNFTAKSMSSVFSQYSDYELDEIVTLDGKSVIGEDGVNEYYLDEGALDALILRMLYTPKK